MARLCRWQKRKNHDAVRHGIYPTLLASCATERVYEDPALRAVGESEQNKKTDTLQEADQHTDSVKGKASDSAADPETDWPRH